MSAVGPTAAAPAGSLSRRPVSRAAVIRAMDRAFIEGIGLPSVVLMEHAARGCAEVLLARHGAVPTVVLCGPGNNGGDGYAITRHLAVAGARVTAVEVYAPRSPDAVVFHGVAARLGLTRTREAADFTDASLIVDAVFGTGQRGPIDVPEVPGLAAAVAAGVPLVAIDVPTGIDADTGERVGVFPEADFTVTIGRLKPFLFRAAAAHALVDIGLELAAAVAAPSVGAPEAELVEEVGWTPFPAAATKWERGHVGIVAGSAEKAGAGVLAALGALRAGAGLVTLFIPRDAWARLGALPPEIMVEDLTAAVAVPGGFPRADALVLGPGLGRRLDDALRRIWREDPRPCVYDADALRALDAGLLSSFTVGARLITPHSGEAAHLLGRPWRDLEADRLATAAALRALAPAIYKGACPIVTGAPLHILAGGLPQMGTGGSGDVLAGACGAFLARKVAGVAILARLDREEVEAEALAAAWLHQRAGRLAGGVGIGATAIADALVGARAALPPGVPGGAVR